MELCHRLYRGVEPIHIGAIFIGLTIIFIFGTMVALFAMLFIVVVSLL